MGTCCGMGRSTPLNPMRASTLHRSSNESVEFPQTDAMTLCFRRVRRTALAWFCAACVIGAAMKGATAIPARNCLRFMRGTIPSLVVFGTPTWVLLRFASIHQLCIYGGHYEEGVDRDFKFCVSPDSAASAEGLDDPGTVHTQCG